MKLHENRAGADTPLFPRIGWVQHGACGTQVNESKLEFLDEDSLCPLGLLTCSHYLRLFSGSLLLIVTWMHPLSHPNHSDLYLFPKVLTTLGAELH